MRRSRSTHPAVRRNEIIWPTWRNGQPAAFTNVSTPPATVAAGGLVVYLKTCLTRHTSTLLQIAFHQGYRTNSVSCSRRKTVLRHIAAPAPMSPVRAPQYAIGEGKVELAQAEAVRCGTRKSQNGGPQLVANWILWELSLYIEGLRDEQLFETLAFSQQE